jgi:CBS domain-containing protein
VDDVARFLRRHEPFADLDDGELTAIAQVAEIEEFAAGQEIFGQGEEPAERVRMVMSGAVELLDDGRTLDLLGEGELFGHPSMLAGLPTGFAARAHEDTRCLRLPSERLLPLLARPAGLRYVARSLLARPSRPELSGDGAADPARRPAAAFVREDVVLCEPGTGVREVARAMAQRGASCALVRLGDGALGILTDQDLRVRVVGGTVPLDAPVEDAMTAPAFTAPAAQLGSELMVEMINRGIRHVPVVSPRGDVLGIVTDIDLLASDTRTPFMLRRRIARAADAETLVEAARDLRPTVLALHEARVAATQLAAIIAAFAEAITRRAIELLTPRDEGLPPVTWFAAGSLGRREAFASSDVDSAMAWDGDDADERPRALAADVLAVLERCGFAADTNAASAAHPLFGRSVADWRDWLAGAFDRSQDTRVVIVVAAVADARVVAGAGEDPFAVLASAHQHPQFMRRLQQMALAHRPPTGFLRDIVVEGSGEHRGRLDIKQGGFQPIVHLARYAALAAGSRATGTVERLDAAADARVLTQEDATTLTEAFELFAELRMGHQLDQLRAGQDPDDFLDPADLNPLVRRYLREAFRAIARVQRRLSLRT